LESQPGWKICSESETGREAVEQTRALRPDIAVLDITMPELSGIDAARQIQRESPGTKILILLMHYSEQLMEELRSQNIQGYVVKSDSSRDLVREVEALTEGQSFFTHLETKQMPYSAFGRWSQSSESELSFDRLTIRESQIVRLLAEGKSDRDMASLLDISVKTVETHRTNLMRKLELHNVADMVRYAVRNQIIEA
jgi:DNA-binding NarL/FixJ family response regulator